MKICNDCKKEKDEKEFNINRARCDGLQTVCKVCSAIRYKNYYYANQDDQRAKAVGRNKARCKKLREKYQSFKSKLYCLNCGENESCCIEFHHLNPNEKDANISGMISRKISFIRIFEEIKKCIALCSNCHRKFHANKLEISQDMIDKMSKLNSEISELN